MGILETLTLIFIVLKLTGYIAWTWFWVLSPMIFAILMYISIITGYVIFKSRK